MSLCRNLKSRQLTLIIVLSLSLCILSSGCTQTQPEQKVYNVAILSGLDFLADTTDGFKEGMENLGYVEGENIVYDVQIAPAPIGNQEIIQKFVDDKVDLIFAFPTEASMETKEVAAGTGVPVVFAIANIEDTGLVDSVRQPGGDITGVRYPGPDIAIKRFEIMQELVPDAKIIWIPYQRGYPIVASQMEVLRQPAEDAGITLIEFPADNAAELQAELDRRDTLDDIGIDAIMAVAEPLFVTPDAFEVMGKFAYEHQIPIGGAIMLVGGYGSIFGVHVNDVEVGKQAATLADKILKGTPAGTIPVVSAENFFEINYTVAENLGVTVPEGLLSMADEVFR